MIRCNRSPMGCLRGLVLGIPEPLTACAQGFSMVILVDMGSLGYQQSGIDS